MRSKGPAKSLWFEKQTKNSSAFVINHIIFGKGSLDCLKRFLIPDLIWAEKALVPRLKSFSVDFTSLAIMVTRIEKFPARQI